MGFTFEADNPYAIRVGDIITSDGKRHKVTKVTTTAIAATRYYWFDAMFDKLTRKRVRTPEVLTYTPTDVGDEHAKGTNVQP